MKSQLMESIAGGRADGLDARAFAELGHVVVRGLVDARTLAKLRKAVERVLEAGKGLAADTVVGGAKFQVQSRSGRSEDGAVAPGVLRKVTFAHFLDGTLAAFQHDPRIIGAIESLGLRRPRCLVDQVNLKPPRVGTSFPWHQDLAFLGAQQREQVMLLGGVNVVLALDEADRENGAFEVLSGTHHAGLVELAYDLGSEWNAGPAAFGGSVPTVVELQAGDAVFFHPLLAHGSAPNRSDRLRRMLAYWFAGRGAG